jgi:hypothetical protein
VTVEPVTPEFRSAKQLSGDRDGVRVAAVDAAGPAARRLFPNDVITRGAFPDAA